jgi:hypothetical protein
VHVVTNVKAYEKLRKEKYAQQSKAQAERAGRDDKPPKRELSAAELKQKASDRARQRTDRIAAWRHKLLRRAITLVMEMGGDSGLRLVIAYAANPCAAWRKPQIDDLLEAAAKPKPRADHFRKNYWPCVAYEGTLEDTIGEMAQRLLADEAPDWRSPTLPHGLVENLACDLSIDVGATWERLQAGDGKPDPMIEEFFLLHQTDELRALGKELGVYLDAAKNRGAMVKLLLATISGTRRLPLPKCIKPLAGGEPKAKAKAGKGKRSR